MYADVFEEFFFFFVSTRHQHRKGVRSKSSEKFKLKRKKNLFNNYLIEYMMAVKQK